MLLSQVGHPSALRRKGTRLSQLAAITCIFVFSLCIWRRNWQLDYDAGNDVSIRPQGEPAVEVPVEVPEEVYYDDGEEYWQADYGSEEWNNAQEGEGEAEAEEEFQEVQDDIPTEIPDESLERPAEDEPSTPAQDIPSSPAADDAAATPGTPASNPSATPAAPASLSSQEPPSDSQHSKTYLEGHIVVATLHRDNIDWAYAINVPNLEVIRYVADDPHAQYHPPENKGHEAMMYFQYMYDFYDHLPDYAIFTHSEDRSWHVESLFEGSLRWAIEHMDLSEVMRRKYFNLRVSWRSACPDWIRTTNTHYNQFKTEEPYMHDAFAQNFINETVPEILAQPCCSQFALSREAIRSVPREQYKFHIDWLLTTDLPDSISGRTWEHMFQYLFTKKAVDCPLERQTYCRSFHICFKSDLDLMDYEKQEKLIEGYQNRLKTIGRSNPTALRMQLLTQIEQAEKRKKTLLEEALVTGQDEAKRLEIAPDIYSG